MFNCEKAPKKKKKKQTKQQDEKTDEAFKQSMAESKNERVHHNTVRTNKQETRKRNAKG